MNHFVRGAFLCFVMSSVLNLAAQDISRFQTSDAYTRKNTFTLFAEYSPTSSHILMGAARQRILADFGGAYTRRLFRFWNSDLGYHVELHPALFESDPLQISTSTLTVTSTNPQIPSGTQTENTSSAPVGKCIASSGTLTFPPGPGYTLTGTYTNTCGRQWTVGQAFAPIGLKYSMRTRHPLQPYILGTLGYMYTSRPVPVSTAESFNFVFDFGAGIELFRSANHKRSIALETRFHHFSNRDTAQSNPGTDNIVYNLAYSFGR